MRIERLIVSNSPFEPTEPGSYVPNPNPNTPPPSPYEPSGSQMPTNQQPSTDAPPPPPYEPSDPYQQPNPYTSSPPPPYEPSGLQMPSPRKDRKKTSRLFVFLAIIAIVVVVIGGLSWFLIRAG